jgi:hypothetical protein
VSTKWNQNLIAFALLTKENDRNFRIEAVERGSLVFYLSAVPVIIMGFAKAIDKVLDVIKKYYEVRKIYESAKQLKSGVPDKIIHDLENASKLKIRAEANDITDQLIEEYGWNKDENLERRDVDTAIRIAVKHILDFINKGGKLDIKFIAQGNKEKEIEMNISLKYTNIKQLENQLTAVEGQSQMLEISDGESDEEENAEVANPDEQEKK